MLHLSKLCRKRWQNIQLFFYLNIDHVGKFGEFVTKKFCGIPTKDEYDDDLMHAEIHLDMVVSIKEGHIH